MFIRSKRIKGKEYAYCVKNKWTRKGARQKVSKYLGRVIRPEQVDEMDFYSYIDVAESEIDEYMHQKTPTEIIQELLSWVLHCYGFVEQDSRWTLDDIVIHPAKKTVRAGKRNEKKVSLFVNEDYMCSLTLRNLFNFRSSEGKSEVAVSLAKALINAGIPVPREVFVLLFEKIYKPGQSYVF